MSGGRRCAPVLAALMLAATPPGAVTLEPPAVRLERLDGGVRLDVVLAGGLIDYATPRVAGERRTVLLLAGDPPDADSADAADAVCPTARSPLRLWRLEAERLGETAPPALRLLRDDVPGDATALHAADLNGDGRDELLLERPGELLWLGEAEGDLAGAPRPLITAASLGLPATELQSNGFRLGSDPSLLAVGGVGWVRFFRPAAGGAPWAEVARTAMPFETDRGPLGFRLRSPTLWPLGRDDAGREVYATSPQQIGEQRLRAFVVRVDVERREAALEECWARLPGAEQLLEHEPALLDGKPVLLALTTAQNRLSLFGEKRLRVLPLAADRSRLGHPPAFAVETRINLWQATSFFLVDVDGDGARELVLAYWKGLKDDRVVLDVYPRQAGGSFARSPRTTAFDVPSGARSFIGFGDDVTGNGAADLLLLGDDRLRVHQGRGSSRNVVETRPGRTLPLGGEWPEAEAFVGVGAEGVSSWSDGPRSGPPRPVDLDGDGRGEVLLHRPEATENEKEKEGDAPRGVARPTRFSVFRLSPDGPG